MPTSVEQSNITWALSAFNASARRRQIERYQLYRDYYAGDHRLNFATEKFLSTFGQLFQALAENLCAPVVDIHADLLQIEAWDTPEMNDIWRRNRMDERAGAIHKSALMYGDFYLVVWHDPVDESQPYFYPNAPELMVCEFDSEKIGLIKRAAKRWIETRPDGTQRLNLTLYFPDRIEKYAAPITAGRGVASGAGAFSAREIAGEPWPLPNPYNKVPVFRFANNAGPGEPGMSEIENIIPPNDALNKLLCDMLVASEFEAFAQRWITGLEVKRDADGNVIPPFRAGIDRVWAIEADKDDVQIGEFSRADLKNFIEGQNSFRAAISRISGIPLHYFMMEHGGWPSGEALKTAMTRMLARRDDRQISFGNTWADAARFALEIRGIPNAEPQPVWKDTDPQIIATPTPTPAPEPVT